MESVQNNNLTVQYSTGQNKHSRIKPAVPNFSASIDENQPNKKTPIINFFKSMIAPVILWVGASFIHKFIKDDAKIGINKEDVEKVLNYMDEKHKLTKDHGFKILIAPAGSKKAKELIENCGGATFSYSQEGKSIQAATERASNILHEAGHVINHNCTSLGKAYLKTHWSILSSLAKYKLPAFFGTVSGLPILITGLLCAVTGISNLIKSRKKPEEEKQNPIIKFIHDNLGALTLLAFTPQILDESMATYRALSATKKIAPNILKPLSKNLLVALSSYIIPAASIYLAVLAGRTFSDELKEKKQHSLTQ